jgi:hypothetical protein
MTQALASRLHGVGQFNQITSKASQTNASVTEQSMEHMDKLKHDSKQQSTTAKTHICVDEAILNH